VKAATNVKITRMTLNRMPSGATLFPKQAMGTNFSDNVTVSPDGNGSFTVYMPENCSGTVASIKDQTGRTSDKAPNAATYLKIEGELTGPTDVGWIVDKKRFESVVYLGSDTAGDFNIHRNNDYLIDINIRGDLTNDYRIATSRAGYEIGDQWTPDRKFLLGESVPFTLYFNGSGSETVSYKCVFEGNSLSKLTVGWKALTGNSVSGTIAAGKNVALDIVNNEDLYTSENHRVKCTLTFTDSSGATTEYIEELRFSNRTGVQTLPIYGVPPSEKTANVICSPDDSIVQNTSNSYTLYHAKRSIELSIEPLPGYTFKGWYSGYPFKSEGIISTSPKVTVTVPRKSTFSVYARIEKI
jgi:uncharacterized repeat protein (TIGR02543 family)